MNNRRIGDACDALVMLVVMGWISSGRGFVMLVMLLLGVSVRARECVARVLFPLTALIVRYGKLFSMCLAKTQ